MQLLVYRRQHKRGRWAAGSQVHAVSKVTCARGWVQADAGKPQPVKGTPVACTSIGYTQSMRGTCHCLVQPSLRSCQGHPSCLAPTPACTGSSARCSRSLTSAAATASATSTAQTAASRAAPVAATASAPAPVDAEFERFHAAVQSGANVVPVCRRIFSDQLTPVLAYRCLVKENDTTSPSFLLESVVNGDQQGRWVCTTRCNGIQVSVAWCNRRAARVHRTRTQNG